MGSKTANAHVWPLLSVDQALTEAEHWETMPGERRMVASVLRWLVKARWLGNASHVAFELPWRGRRIDLVIINGRGGLSTFEFKLGGTRRVFEQAIYNSCSAHRSYVVSGARPRKEYQELAQSQGLGIFTVNGKVDLIQRPQCRDPQTELVRLLRRQVRSRYQANV